MLKLFSGPPHTQLPKLDTVEVPHLTFEAFVDWLTPPEEDEPAQMEERPEPPVLAQISQPLTRAQAIRAWDLHHKQRAATGLTPILITDTHLFRESFDWGWGGISEQLRLFHEAHSEPFHAAQPSDEVRAALERIEACFGEDLHAAIPRISLGHGMDTILEEIAAQESSAEDWLEDTPQVAQSRDEALRAAAASIPVNTVRLLLMGCPDAQIPIHLVFGGFNNCPPAWRHAATWRAWHQRHDAELVFVGSDTLIGVATPPPSRAALLQLAQEQLAYCRDLGAEGASAVVATLAANPVWSFWWD